MSLPLRIFVTAFLVGLSVYFALIWNGNVPRPNGFPIDEMDPPTFLVGIAMASLLWIEQIKGWWGRRRR